MPKAAKDKPVILSENLFPVVGVGASAGGLDAFKKFIKAIPENSGMAYIIVQHLHPEHESALPDILQRATKIPVTEIRDNVHVEANHIYVIPANKMLVASDGILQLSPRAGKNKLHLPIDIFFSSLAQVHQAQAIGVILSGTGADGTGGLKDIKNHGGLTIAQAPSTAAYDAMPQHAIDAEVIDFILLPENIPGKLMELKQSFTISSSHDGLAQDNKTNENIFRQIFTLLRINCGVDFTFYKQTTIRRRIIRRMVILKLENVSDYLEYIKTNKPEQDILFQDLLIPVTSFFRDVKSFDLLCEMVFPQLVENKSAINPLRIWIAGCSTGQETYSIAMCLQEYLNEHGSNIKVQIFATDLSEKSIKTARSGIYSQKEVEGISEERLHQFFNKIDGHYQVKKTLRDMCVFAVQNFLKDPPFANIDCISCRNVLIYLEPFLQQKAFTIFHYALNDKGVLWLGKSEATGNASDLFIPSNKKDKFYTRKSAPGKFTHVAGERSETSFRNYFLRGKEVKTDDFKKNADNILLSKYIPAGVVVNNQFDIVQFRGSTGPYLESSPGIPNLNVFKMAKEGLAFELRNALHKAKATGEPLIKEGIQINKGKTSVAIEVIPLLDTIDLHFLILFREQVSAIIAQRPVTKKEKAIFEKNEKDEKQVRIEQLEKELSQSREDMHSITDEQEAANEELQSSNEELLSGSEELQSLNEELETSKEELQSTNEELITTNQELYDRNEQLNESRKFAEATISTLHEPLLVLDKSFRIKSADKSFYKTFFLTEEETVGKILFELQESSWDTPALRKELQNILKENEKMIETEITFTFPVIGQRTICFNTQSIRKESGEQLILLALDDVTLKRNTAQILKEKTSADLKKQKEFAEQLRKQIAVKMKLEKQKDEFISMASHELKTPVTSIKGYTQILQHRFKKEGNNEAVEFLGRMDKQINKLTSLISDLLDSSKVTAGQLRFTEQFFDFNELVTETVEEMRNLSTSHIINTKLDASEKIFGDRNRIGQVMTNMLSNAIKYSPRSYNVMVTTEHKTNHIKFCVQDFGIGIPKENQPHVFDQFYRVSGEVQDTFPGLGLGLFIASEIIRRSKGTMSVESEMGQGSTFCFTLPIKK